MFEVSESTWRLSPSSASAKQPRARHPEVAVEALLELGLPRSRAAPPSAGSFQNSRASRAQRTLAS